MNLVQLHRPGPGVNIVRIFPGHGNLHLNRIIRQAAKHLVAQPCQSVQKNPGFFR